jgi:predicted hotdog family 3-hydroxylacyl-ACP dehydratase
MPRFYWHKVDMVMLVSSVEAYIPHRGAMRFIDRLVSLGPEHVVVEADVRADQLFVQGGQLPAWVGVELMAQAIAAWAGGQALGRGEAVRIGFLLGTRRYVSDCTGFAVGTVLTIEARAELVADNGLGMFACRILVAGVEQARAHVSVFEPKDGQSYLQELEGTGA